MMRRCFVDALTTVLVGGVLTGAAPAVPAAAALPSPPSGWTEIAQTRYPEGRIDQSMTYSADLGRLIMWGGTTKNGSEDEVWLLDPERPENGWTTIRPTGEAPVPRTEPSMVWDATEHRLILFGGIVPAPGEPYGVRFLNDVWALTLDVERGAASWTRLHEGGGGVLAPDVPQGRMAHAAAYDPVRRRMVVYGGLDQLRFANAVTLFFVDDIQRAITRRSLLQYALGDLWSFDLETSSWEKLSEEGPRRYLAEATYDPVSEQLVILGGLGPTPEQGSIWTPHSFDLKGGGGWAAWNPDGDTVPFRELAVAYSAERGAVLFTGWPTEDNAGFDERHVYGLQLGPRGEGSRWLSLPGAGFGTFAYSGRSATLLPSPERFVALGGRLGGTGDPFDWRLRVFDTASGRWFQSLPGLAAPRPLASADMVRVAPGPAGLLAAATFDTVREQWWLDLENDRWLPEVAPADSTDDGMAQWVPAIQRFVSPDGCLHRLRMLPAQGAASWGGFTPLGEAPALCGATMAYDSRRSRLLVLGGHQYKGSSSYVNYDVFALDLGSGAHPVWRRLAVTGAPPLVGGDPIYDPFGDRLIVVSITRDTHILDLDADAGAWRKLPAASQAPLGSRVFDVANARVLSHTGCGDGRLYELRPSDPAPVWTEVPITGDPLKVCGGAAYDAARRRLIAVGKGRTYALDLGGTLSPPPPGPAAVHQPPLASDADPGRWAVWGPTGAGTHDVDLLPDGSALAATTAKTNYNARGAGVYRSTDAGRTWSAALGSTAGAGMTEIATAPSDPSVVYGVAIAPWPYFASPAYVSRDGGRSWAAASHGLPRDTYWAVAVHATDPDVAWVGGARGGLYRTQNGGASWHEVARSAFEDLRVNALTMIPGPVGLRLLAGVQERTGAGVGEGGVLYSDDLGQTWSVGFLTQEQFVKALAADPADPRRLLAAEGYGVWRSDDAGTTWKHVNGGTWREPTGDDIHLAAIEFDPTSDGRVAWGGGLSLPCSFKDGSMGGSALPPFTEGLWRTTNGGKAWTRVSSVPFDDICGLAVSADGKTVIASGLATGLWRSEDGGATWSNANAGITQRKVVAVAPHPTLPDTAVAAAGDDGLMVTTDAGATWSNPVSGFYAAHVIPIEARPGRFVALADETVYVTENGGQTWKRTGVPAALMSEQPGGLAAHPADPDTWFFWGYDENPNTFGSRLGITHDNGSSYELVRISDPQTGKTVACPWTIEVDPNDAQRIWVGDCGQGVFRSTDGGATWRQVNEGLENLTVQALFADPSSPGTIYAGTEHLGVYRSDDGGTTWRPARTGLGYGKVMGLARSADGHLIASSLDDGMYASSDGGQTWARAMDGVASAAPLGLQADPRGRVFAGSWMAGALVLDVGGGQT